MTRAERLFAVVVGVIYAGFLIVSLHFQVSNWQTYMPAWLKEWQELAGSVLALIAAGATIWAVFRQIQSTEREARRRFERKVSASRAAIAGSLSALAATENNLIEHFVETLQGMDENGVYESSLEVAPVSAEILDNLIVAIENSHEPATHDLSELVAELQIQNSRLESLRLRSERYPCTGRLRLNIKSYSVDAVLLKARIQRLFYYVRRQDNQYVATQFKHAVFGSCGMDIADLAIENEVERSLERRPDPWLSRQF